MDATFFDIGVRAASDIPMGVGFGSIPVRLIKSQNSHEDQKIGFVEVTQWNKKGISFKSFSGNL